MPDTARRIPYYYTTVPNKAGEGAKLLEVFKKAGVNFRAVHAFPAARKAQVDLFPTDAAALEKAAREGGIKLSAQKTAFWIEGEDRVGALADVLRKLGEAGINVIATDALVSGTRYSAILWVAPQDVSKAASALGAAA